MTWEAKEHEKCFIDGGIVVGKSTNDSVGGTLATSSPRGIITPRSEWFGVKNVEFHNWNWMDALKNPAAAIGSCSHCWHGAATDSGARQVNFSGLKFTDVTTRINYQVPWRAIYYDADGTLTGEAKGWATPYWKHNHWPGECDLDSNQYSASARSPSADAATGLKCKGSVTVRRVAWYGYSPSNFRLQSMRIAGWESATRAANNTKEKLAAF